MAKKQAVILIHGVGEQVPMDTLRGFVNAVWSTDGSLRNPDTPSTVWSKPDDVSGNFELRRLTTASNTEGKRTDFFEFYWAHLMEGTQLAHVRAWLRVLLFRSPSRVLPQFRQVWWAIVVLVLGGAAAAFVHLFITPLPQGLLKVGSALWLLFGSTLIWFLIHYAGDAARYLHVAPPNIKSRREIRDAGVDLVEKLHASGKYDRIIIVGHSLGTVIGYDILTHVWAKYHQSHAKTSSPEFVALQGFETFLRQNHGKGFDRTVFQQHQAQLLAELQRQQNPWLISDFVTMGSPLAHAPMLMARTAEEFSRKLLEREFPSCPPFMEVLDGVSRFSFEARPGVWVPHHAAVFAVTRWINLYFPCCNILWGDVIGGPIAPAFGPGVEDVEIKTSFTQGVFTHTAYWTQRAGEDQQHIAHLRHALRLGPRFDTKPHDTTTPPTT